MFRGTIPFLIFILALAFVVSCSGGNEGIVMPGTNDGVIPPDGTDNDTPRVPTDNDIPPAPGGRGSITEAGGNTNCLGFWHVVIDPETGNIDAVNKRTAELILNVLGFLEPPALTGMTINFGTLVINDPVIEVDVILRHPIPDPTFMGFDVRGVVFGPEITNADGLTVIPGPEYFTGVPFGYQDGLLGVPDSHANYWGLAGYKYFCDGLGKDEDLVEFMSDPGNLSNRGVFSEGPNKNTRHYVLDWADSDQGFFVFNYAIYANYDWPVGSPPIDIDDFPIETANCAEAFSCSISEIANTLYYADGTGAGSISLMVEAWDWLGDIADVSIESVEPGLIPIATVSTSLPGSTPYSYIFELNDVTGTPHATGELDILITVTDTKTFGECWFLDLLTFSNQMYDKNIFNCFTYTTTVVECPVPIIASLDPNNGEVDTTLDDVIINGAGFVGGPSEDVRLKKTGEADIVATDVQFVDLNTITADFDLTGAALGMWDVVVTNGCGEESTGVEMFSVGCPEVTVSGINPPSGFFNGSVDDAIITGTGFATGTSEDVRLKKTGEPDIVGTDVQFVSFTSITADFDLSGVALGQWDVVVTNGCDEEGTGGGLFEVQCPTPTITGINPPSGYVNGFVNNAAITGTGFISGASEDVRLKKTGESDIVGTDVQFVSLTSITADFLLTGTAVGQWDVVVTNGCDEEGTGSGLFEVVCPTPNVTGINPNNHDPDNIQFFATINGSGFIDGPNLEVKLKKTGETDIDAANVSFGTSSIITCYITIPLDTALGFWDVEVTNGCGGTPGTGAGLFFVRGGWARTWGGVDNDYGGDVVMVGSNVYVGGQFQGMVDFDPGEGTDNHTSNGDYDSFLCKYNAGGGFLWARTWGGTCQVLVADIAADDSGNIYVGGRFWGCTVDFDPGPGVDEHAADSCDAYLSKFNPDGDFQWVLAWGNSQPDQCVGVAVDSSSNSLYAVGNFIGNTDFDPGPGTDWQNSHYSTGNNDCYISKFDLDGNYQWARTWGGWDPQICYSVAVGSTGDIYIAGTFRGGTYEGMNGVDFDPGPGVWLLFRHGSVWWYYDAFISKFNSAGIFQWAYNWGGGNGCDDYGFDIAVDGSDNAYVVGRFRGSNVDFDPGAGSDLHSSNYYASYLTKFNSSGAHQMAVTWGGATSLMYDAGFEVYVDNANAYVYVAGQFSGTNVDFDPGPGVSQCSSNGALDAYLSKFNLNGGFVWARNWGGTTNDNGHGGCVNPVNGNPFVTGGYSGGNVDFDPGTGTDNHSSEGMSDVFLCKFRPNGYW